MLLEKIQTPDDLKRLSYDDLECLASEIRQELINTVARNGGHLASNLGIVELTIAMHRVFDMPKDKIVFDVGHQSYIHKLLTGRYNRFGTLREHNGISGFPRREESIYDCFETGHASTSISAALGMARARDHQKQDFNVVAVVGDGALTGGMCYEALNDAGNSKTKLIVILNDNEMSIARNVGALQEYFTKLRISGGWQNAKKRVRHLSDVPVIGKPLYKVIHSGKNLLKTVLVKDADIGFFEALGFSYFGPINGHDISGMESTFRLAKSFNGPCVIHVITKKGYGYDKAEAHPETFHGTPPFYVESGNRIELPSSPSCGHVMADTLAELAEHDDRIIAITAAMPLGTGLDHFEEKMPGRMIDVGIAEEHAATMAAGLAAGGMKPYFAVYSSFFQRCYDQMIQDVCMQDLPVTFLLDRSGIGGEDGQTHHGLFDLAALLPVPNMTVLAPCDGEELRRMLRWSATTDHPCAIRYAKENKSVYRAENEVFVPGKWDVIKKGKDAVILAVGSMVSTALSVRDTLFEHEIDVSVVNCSSLKPLDMEVLRALEGKKAFTFEEHMLTGGFGAYVASECISHDICLEIKSFGVKDSFIQHGTHEQLLCDAGLDPAQLSGEILRIMKGV